MGATSVTGVGQGSVEGKNMGSKTWTVGVGRLLGPKVMAADEVTLSGAAATVVLPLFPGVVGDYIVLATDKSGNHSVQAALTFNANDTTITFAGTGTDVIQWAIVKKGLSL
jgi:hypothetical protein